MKTAEFKHTNPLIIEILRNEFADYDKNTWHYDSQYKMIAIAVAKRDEEIREWAKKQEVIISTMDNFPLHKIGKDSMLCKLQEFLSTTPSAEIAQVEPAYQKLFDLMYSEHGLILLQSEMQDIIRCCNEIDHTIKVSELYEINFDGHLKCQIEVAEGKLNVLKAMNGWGDGIPTEDIKIETIH